MPGIALSYVGSLFCILVCSSSLAPTTLSADEPTSPPAERKQKIEKLIDSLVGHQHDQKRQTDVYHAADELLKLGTEAFSQLIDHFDDSRYSFDEEDPTSEKVHHEVVGDYCYRLVVTQVKKYRPWKTSDPRGTPGFSGSIVPPDKKDAKAWWEINKGRALWELQADSVRRLIAEDQDPRWFKFGGKERRKLADDAIRDNEELLKQLIETKTPLPTQPVRPYSSK